eukprot:gene24538-29651_t
MSVRELVLKLHFPQRRKLEEILSRDLSTLPVFVDLPLERAISELQKARDDTPNHDPFLSEIDSVLIPLMEVSRSLFPSDAVGPLDYQPSSAAPAPNDRDQDHLLTDVQEATLLHSVSDMLGKAYLVESSDAVDWSVGVSGRLFGNKGRAMICLPVRRSMRHPAYNVHFLVDTGAPTTELSSSALDTIMRNAMAPSTLSLFIGGIPTQVELSSPTGNHSDINVLGYSFLNDAKLTLRVSYDESKVVELIRLSPASCAHCGQMHGTYQLCPFVQSFLQTEAARVAIE